MISRNGGNAMGSETSIDRKEFGGRLRHFRQNAGMTQKELAEKSGLAVESICKYEQGRRLPKPENMKNLAAALQMPPEDLAGKMKHPSLWTEVLYVILAADAGDYPIDVGRIRCPQLYAIARCLNNAKQEKVCGLMTEEGFRIWKRNLERLVDSGILDPGRST
ncbi:MAG TPA: helix-turn-helix transcriptional regulator [Lachnospiraceae bacterium]|nr:helix-turn-helix transcriptional regulator [Lachnospiraceae bacterium]